MVFAEASFPRGGTIKRPEVKADDTVTEKIVSIAKVLIGIYFRNFKILLLLFVAIWRSDHIEENEKRETQPERA